MVFCILCGLCFSCFSIYYDKLFWQKQCVGEKLLLDRFAEGAYHLGIDSTSARAEIVIPVAFQVQQQRPIVMAFYYFLLFMHSRIPGQGMLSGTLSGSSHLKPQSQGNSSYICPKICLLGASRSHPWKFLVNPQWLNICKTNLCYEKLEMINC